jgi:hypothetical protein
MNEIATLRKQKVVLPWSQQLLPGLNERALEGGKVAGAGTQMPLVISPGAEN